jgi:hypothetical protein
MIKKQIAIFFILLANFLLFAHVAVSQHKSQLRFDRMCCVNDSRPNQNNFTAHNHEHDGQECNFVLVTDGHLSLDGVLNSLSFIFAV